MKRPRIYSALLNPPLLVSESRDEFDSIRGAIIAAVKPTDFIEKLYVSDVTFYTWEVYRLRRTKIATLNLGFESALRSILLQLLRHAHNDWSPEEIIATAGDLASNWFHEKGVQKLVRELLQQQGLDETAIELQTIRRSMKELEMLDRMLASAEARRDKALLRVAEYRAEFACLLRQASDRVIDGEAVVIDEGAGQARARHAQ